MGILEYLILFGIMSISEIIAVVIYELFAILLEKGYEDILVAITGTFFLLMFYLWIK